MKDREFTGAVTSFQQSGWVKVEGLLTREEAGEIDAALAAERARSDVAGPRGEGDEAPGGKVGDIHRSHLNRLVFRRLNNPVIARSACSQRIGGLAARLMGRKQVRLWVDETFDKKPGAGPTPWHQDLAYWPFDRGGALTIWIALDNVEEERGAMQYVPGSKWLGPLGRPQMDDDQLRKRLSELRKHPAYDLLSEPVVVPIKTGDAIVHDCLTLHGAVANTSSRVRRAIAFAYIPDDALYTGMSYPQVDALGLTPFQPFGGELFPLIKLDHEELART
jgi:ectoine hydroxylase-related dioxygenase (phytanoyl-CoA dioxygenase family)